jgi:hypothetical protein
MRGPNAKMVEVSRVDGSEEGRLVAVEVKSLVGVDPRNRGWPFWRGIHVTAGTCHVKMLESHVISKIKQWFVF